MIVWLQISIWAFIEELIGPRETINVLSIKADTLDNRFSHVFPKLSPNSISSELPDIDHESFKAVVRIGSKMLNL